MHTPARTLGTTLAASIGLHGLFLLAAAWLLTVFPSIMAEKPASSAGPATSAGEQPESVDSVLEEEDLAVILIPVEEPPKPPASQVEPDAKLQAAAKVTIIAPENQPAKVPLNSETPFISSQNLRAANAGAVIAGADPTIGTQEGFNQNSPTLTQNDFNPAGEDAAPASGPKPPMDPESLPEPAADPVIAQNTPPPPPPASTEDQRPPDPADQSLTNNPQFPAPATAAAETIPMRDAAAPLLTPKTSGPSPSRPRPQPALKPSTPGPTSRKESPAGMRPKISSLKSKSIGSLSERGDESSVDARDTAEGRYNSQVHQRIGLLWNARLSTVRGLAGLGTVEVDFEIDPTGRISNVKLVDPGKANPILEDVCLTSIIKAKLPPPPEEMLRELRDPLSNGRLRRRFTFHRL